MGNEKQIDEMTFQEAMSELENIVSVLESGSLELEESLDVYSRGVSLLASLQKRLDGAEQKIEVLMGELEAAPDDDIQDSTLLKA